MEYRGCVARERQFYDIPALSRFTGSYSRPVWALNVYHKYISLLFISTF